MKNGEKMALADQPSIKALAQTETSLLPYFSRTDRIIIEFCKELVEASA